ncbi:MAG: glycosyltransferase family 2 protein [Candidatus Kapabacteria bacterium]|nr:glycosyltransferase family 2 protein [Candidatus Kapabacteria bacterium]
MKVLIIVPAYNEAIIIKSVLESIINENPNWDILVINDGSSDKTGEIASELKKVKVVNLPCNLGIGGAVETGFKYAFFNNYDFAVQFDGDGQHKASEINKILQPLIEGSADVVIGSRFLVKSSNWKPNFSRRLGIKIFSLVNSLLIKQKITDNTSGFRAYNRKAIEFLARDNYPTDYPEPEAIILLGKNGFKMMEVFVEMQERAEGKSSISGLKQFYYMFKVLLSILVSSIRAPIEKKPN